MADVCGRCCCQQDGEIEVRQPGRAAAGAPFFQGPLEVADEKRTAPVVVEEMAAAESRPSDRVGPPSAALEARTARGPGLTEPGREPGGAARDPGLAASRRTFKTIVDKGERKLGIDINQHDNVTILVTKIIDGAVIDHNRANPAEAILPGDRIIELNGIRGNTQYMLASCIGLTQLHFAVASGLEWTTHIEATDDAPDRGLGLVVQPSDMVSLVITRIEDGLAMQKAAEPGFDIRPEDRIVRINDVRLDFAALLEEMSSATSWSITWRRIEMREP